MTKKINSATNGNDSDNKSALILVSNYIKSLPRCLKFSEKQ